MTKRLPPRIGRQSALFVVGLAIILTEVVKALLDGEPIDTGVIVLGMTLCGVGVTDYTNERRNGK